MISGAIRFTVVFIFAVLVLPAPASAKFLDKFHWWNCSRSLMSQEKTGYRAQASDYLRKLDPLEKNNPELTHWLKDPEAFEIEMRRRFEEGKKSHPLDPWNFEFFDFAKADLQFLKDGLENRIEAVRAEVIIKTSPRTSKTLKLRMQFLEDVLSEVDAAMSRKKIGYKDYYYLGEYYGRALSSSVDRHLDWRFWKEWGLGIVFADLETEYKNYRARYLPFNKKFGLTFEELFGKEFKYIILLEPHSISWEILFRTQLENIAIAGVSDNVSPGVPGDGYYRHPALWKGHDEYHFAVILNGRHQYINKNNLNKRQWEAIQKRSRFWQDDLVRAIYQIEDLDLRTAVIWFAFRFHRDSGIPTVPSEVTPAQPIWNIILEYYFMKVSGQEYLMGPGVIRKHLFAKQWLIHFWDQYREEEKEIIRQHSL